MSRFKKATKLDSKVRLALSGPAGSGKTYSALAIATGLGRRVAVVDTERGSARKYSDRFDFDVLELENFAPAEYVQALEDAAAERYEVVIVDSISHAWAGKGGALEQVDKAAKRSQGNSFAAWRDVTPQHNALVEALLGCPFHLIGTLRAKMEYVLETNEKGKQVPRKLGLAPIQRDGFEYEFDVFADLTVDHEMIVTKTRIAELDGAVVKNPGRAVGEKLAAWTRGEKPPLVGLLGALKGADLRAAALADVIGYLAQLEVELDGKHGPRADAARAHARDVKYMVTEREAELLAADRSRLENNSYLEGGHDTGLSGGRTDTDEPSDDRASDAD